MDATNAILDEIRYIERSNDVKVLFACESGSRAWGFASEHSDFDVRFVYVRPVFDYLKLESQRDVIDWRLDAENFPCGVDFDSTGWDLVKFLRLLRASNPSTIEWLSTETPYYEDSRFWEVKKLLESCFEPRASAMHYYGMAKKTDLRQMKADLVPAKKYLYLLRGVMAADWVILRLKPAPLVFNELVDAILPRALHSEVDHLLEVKTGGDEKRLVRHSKPLDEWILAHLDAIPEEARLLRRREKPDWEVFDKIFLKMVGLTA